MVTACELASDKTLGIEQVIGDDRRQAAGPAPLDGATQGTLVFAGPRIAPERLNGMLRELGGATLVCTKAAASVLRLPETTLLVAENPRLTFMRAIARHFPPMPLPAGVHPTAVIDQSAHIHPSAHIGPHSVVGAGSSVGEHSVLHAHTVIYPGVRIGARCCVNAGTVIGADGFGYERNDDGALEKFPHVGGVVIGDDVEIGSNTSIDRGSLGNTIVLDGARIDNQVHIAHNVVVGECAAVIAQAMIGGSARIGNGAWIAPGAVIMNQVSIGANATVGLGAVVTKDVADGQVVMGAPAQDEKDFKLTRRVLKQLCDG
jgi:UDP-3-O-[3-hydroxymyristoyl] glucosamine N-acyltransferase